MTRSRPTAFTIVELLVVIAIIGVLVAMLIPAVQAAREAARRTQCRNNLRQLGLAAITHLEQVGHFPTGGWDYRWIGDPDRGFGADQTGGWAFNILPFLEDKSVYELPRDGQPHELTEQQLEGGKKLIQEPLSILYCPSRRAPLALEGSYAKPLGHAHPTPLNANHPGAVCAKTDYAASGGDRGYWGSLIPGSLHLRAVATWRWCSTTTGEPLDGECPGYGYYISPLTGEPGVNGVIFQRSEVAMRHISDGTSNTYLIGEKYVNPEHYDTGHDFGDEGAWCIGAGNEVLRHSWFAPFPDSYGVDKHASFGSAHSHGFHMVFCDGSVRVIDYDVEIRVHWASANRKDGSVRGEYPPSPPPRRGPRR